MTADCGESGHQRVDLALVRQGLARSRGHAKDLIEAGLVRLDTRLVRAAGQRVHVGQQLDVAPETGTGSGIPAGRQWVSRGAIKLQAAFDTWGTAGWSAAGQRCLDIGASTGGFTQVLLVHDAFTVTALDVGTGQLAAALARDPRVSNLTGINIRDVEPEALGDPFDLVVADLSFVSLTLILPTVRRLVTPTGQVVLLVKPQFEVGRAGLTHSGLVQSPRRRIAAISRVLQAARRAGLPTRDLMASPIRGRTGNREYLVWLWSGQEGLSEDEALRRANELVAAETELVREEQGR